MDKKGTGIGAILLAILAFFWLRNRSAASTETTTTTTVTIAAHFVVGDYIQLKNQPNSAIWQITDVKPEMQILNGSTVSTGAYYGKLIRTDSKRTNIYTSFLWGMVKTESEYTKIAYSG